MNLEDFAIFGIVLAIVVFFVIGVLSVIALGEGIIVFEDSYEHCEPPKESINSKIVSELIECDGLSSCKTFQTEEFGEIVIRICDCQDLACSNCDDDISEVFSGHWECLPENKKINCDGNITISGMSACGLIEISPYTYVPCLRIQTVDGKEYKMPILDSQCVSNPENYPFSVDVNDCIIASVEGISTGYEEECTQQIWVKDVD